jgi:hypothetical protein
MQGFFLLSEFVYQALSPVLIANLSIVRALGPIERANYSTLASSDPVHHTGSSTNYSTLAMIRWKSRAISCLFSPIIWWRVDTRKSTLCTSAEPEGRIQSGAHGRVQHRAPRRSQRVGFGRGSMEEYNIVHLGGARGCDSVGGAYYYYYYRVRCNTPSPGCR